MNIEEIKQKRSIKELLEFGIINIDKPSGPTSFSVSEFVCKRLKLRKTSHFGTLDPKVTGVLPVALNRACKLTGYFLGENKEYIGVMRLHEDINVDKIKQTINENFLGKIMQMPPVKSRVKRQNREREIYSFELLEKRDKDVLFKVKCEGGTYIRKLIDDLGKELKIGAHMLELRRIRAGIFKEENQGDSSVDMYKFEKAAEEFEKGNDKLLRNIIIPAEVVGKVYSVANIKEDNLKQILTGKPIYKKDLIKDEGWKKDSIISVFLDERFIGIYKIFRG
ncbi:MAG TPA: RNA-guided pseudouridylation complex pseudouridine synthase subunit Cbf5, partial [Candidatus Pacearchaeota archaeon]|nr:RNA-guided pseudouridylation complex pseudouridine synthase subunit Cbf5 [Candidatus Pacearchaeota archaeon]